MVAAEIKYGAKTATASVSWRRYRGDVEILSMKCFWYAYGFGIDGFQLLQIEDEDIGRVAPGRVSLGKRFIALPEYFGGISIAAR